MAHALRPSAATAAAGTHIARLSLSDFRSYATLRLTLDGGPRPVVLTGANGAGKTNLLEAVSYLAPGRGLRGARLTEVARMGARGGWAVAAKLITPGGDADVGTGLAPGGGTAFEENEDGGARRVVRIDGETAPGPAALGRHCAMLWITPAMDRLFTDAAAGRRRFLDRIVLALHPGHGRQVSAYEQAMRERNRLLSERGPRADPAWLGAVEGRMAEGAVAIAAARRDTVAQLGRRACIAAQGPFPHAGIAISGFVEDLLAAGPALAAEDRFKAELQAMRPREAAVGRTLTGPHRSDLAVRHLEKDMPAHLCSTGEQKALLIGLVLAHAGLVAEVTGTAPMLLLDEVAAHLDAGRRAGLFDALSALDGQAWLTGTDRSLFEDLGERAQAFIIADGRVTPSAL